MIRRVLWYLCGLSCLALTIPAAILSPWVGIPIAIVVYIQWAFIFGSRTRDMTLWHWNGGDRLLTAVMWPISEPIILGCFTDTNKEMSNGRHRSTQTNPSNPGTGTSTGPLPLPGNSSAVYTTSTRTSSALVLSRSQIETVDGDMPILAHRAARLVPTRNGLRFAAITDASYTFGIDAEARCTRHIFYFTGSGAPTDLRHPTPAPDLNCSCGFYAVPADVPAQHSDGTLDLLVELSGIVIEHERGYRASHQRVIECGKQADGIKISDNAVVGAFCATHRGDGVFVSRDDLAAVLGVPIGDEP